MSKKQQPRNLGESILARLKNKAKARGEDFGFLLERYFVERLLYRISISPYAEKLILKGGTLFLAWHGYGYRSTRDIDLLGHGLSQVAEIEAVFKTICSLIVEQDDGVVFLPDTVHGTASQDKRTYPGVTIKLRATIGTAKQDLTIDIGFGDDITPSVELLEYPILLDMPTPQLRVYPRYTFIAEKFEAMVDLGIRNSRMKDFFDIWVMSYTSNFDGDILRQAIEKTLKRRKTSLPESTPFAFTEEFYTNQEKMKQWKAFRKQKARSETPDDFEKIVRDIIPFLIPIIEAIRNRQSFPRFWSHTSRLWLDAPMLPREKSLDSAN